ncbi:SGNH hydrolase-type esterase domain-containing protein [Aspergillus egyptiacus]|nr:SGNH hydrolase-type esterase domain-containing protein [Aspergillus egyptiacus]
MRLLVALSLTLSFCLATILDNGQPRRDPYPGQAILLEDGVDAGWNTYGPDAEEISYKGRWDDQYISWWSAPGVKFAFTGQKLALGFGKHTVNGVLVAYRIGGQDWEFANVTANEVHQFIGPWTTGINLTAPSAQKTFELRVQLAAVSVEADAAIYKVEPFSKMVEITGDSLSCGDFASYEALSSWAYLFSAGLGKVEYHITAYPGICLVDQRCFANPRGQSYQWYRTSDTSPRAQEIYGNEPPDWDFRAQQPADLVVINIGTNDHDPVNNIPSERFYTDYVKLVTDIHRIWPKAQIVLMSLWGYWAPHGDTYVPEPLYVDEIRNVYKHFYTREEDEFIHYFNTAGILQHNDNGPKLHPTDVGHIKIAAHLMQWVKMTFGWEMEAVGPMVHSGTLYWNNQGSF